MEMPQQRAAGQVEECILYYERLLAANAPGENWTLGLFMAKQWRRMLHQEKPDLEEVRLLSLVLKKESGYGSCGGSQWHSMSIEVNRWLEFLEQNGANRATS